MLELCNDFVEIVPLPPPNPFIPPPPAPIPPPVPNTLETNGVQPHIGPVPPPTDGGSGSVGNNGFSDGTVFI